MWSLVKILLLIAFFTLPGWAFLLLLALVFYFGFFKSIQTKQKNDGAINLPTWFREENFKHIQEKSGPKYKKAVEVFLRTSAELQSRKDKKKQRVVILDNVILDDVMLNDAIDPNFEFATQPKPQVQMTDFTDHRNHGEHKNTDDYDERKKTTSYHCRQCNLTFTGTTRQVCHLSDCPFGS